MITEAGLHDLISPQFVERADQIFMEPNPTYPWDEIVSGVTVRCAGTISRKLMAVDSNTIRGFHRIDQNMPGALSVFVEFFLRHKSEIIDTLSMIRSHEEFNELVNRICAELKNQMSNVRRDQLHSYNKIRKPVDLYFENLVGMATELSFCRKSLVPLLSLPLDSQILSHPQILSEMERAYYRIRSNATYRDVTSKEQYSGLQGVIRKKADSLSMVHQRPYHPVYFDLLWNDRYLEDGGNLYETIPLSWRA